MKNQYLEFEVNKQSYYIALEEVKCLKLPQFHYRCNAEDTGYLGYISTEEAPIPVRDLRYDIGMGKSKISARSGICLLKTPDNEIQKNFALLIEDVKRIVQLTHSVASKRTAQLTLWQKSYKHRVSYSLN